MSKIFKVEQNECSVINRETVLVCFKYIELVDEVSVITMC